MACRAATRAGFVDKMITFAVRDARAEAVRSGVTPTTISGGQPWRLPVRPGHRLARPKRLLAAHPPGPC